jgi:hypothetical protein
MKTEARTSGKGKEDKVKSRSQESDKRIKLKFENMEAE